MSSYVDFYLKHPKLKTYLPIASYSRSCVEYGFFSEYIPYGKTIPLSKQNIHYVINDINDKKDEYKCRIEDEKNFLNDILKANNPLDEKTETIWETRKSIKDWEKSIKELDEVICFARFLIRAISEIEYDSNMKDVSIDEYVWASLDDDPNYKGEE